MSREITFPQRRQRELAWMLYITEGYIANMRHCLAINCVTFNDADKREAEVAIESATKQAARLRRHLSSIAIHKEPKHEAASVLQPKAKRDHGIFLAEFI